MGLVLVGVREVMVGQHPAVRDFIPLHNAVDTGGRWGA